MVKYEPKTTKVDLAKTISEQFNMPFYKSLKIVDSLFNEMFRSLSMGIPVTVLNFGSLKPFEDLGTQVFIVRDGQPPVNKRLYDGEPVMDVLFSSAPRLREAMDNPKARQTSARYSKSGRRPRKNSPQQRQKGTKRNDG